MSKLNEFLFFILGKKIYNDLRLFNRAIKIIFNISDQDTDNINLHLKFIKEDSIIFDIGSNKGYFTYYYAKGSTNSFVYSFEPIKETYEQQLRLLKLFKIKNCMVQNIAFNDINGTVNMVVPSKNGFIEDPCARLKNKCNDYGSVSIFEVTCKTINSFIEQEKITKIDLVKIDVEGAELIVFSKADKLLLMKPIIFSEMLDSNFIKYNYSKKDLICYLAKFNYKAYCFDKKTNKLVPLNSQNDFQTDYYFIHQEYKNELLEKYF